MTIPAFDWQYGASLYHATDGTPRHTGSPPFPIAARILHSAMAGALVDASEAENTPTVVIPAPVWESFSTIRSLPARQPGDSRALTITGQWLDTLTSLELHHDSQPQTLSLSDVVFGTVFNPADSSRQWPDLVQAFCWAFRDRGDATLLIKLTGGHPSKALALIQAELRKLPPFKGRVIALGSYLDSTTYQSFVGGSDFFVTASGAEGQCLPMLEFMAAGRPPVAPRHTGLAEYLTDSNSLDVRCFREWTAGPYDNGSPYRTYIHHVDWQSLTDTFIHAHEMRTRQTERYRMMAHSCMERIRTECSETAAIARLAPVFSALERRQTPRLTGPLVRWLAGVIRRF